ncbi:MAG: hypothetical protein II680_10060 [Clostridia bacterium]|nr:hypothetical protein [Clostridia bacterium]
MRRIARLLTVFLLLASLFVCSAPGTQAAVWSADMAAGEILYRQSFADLSDFDKSGWTKGTSASEKATVSVKDGAMRVRCMDGGRAYVLMPSVSRGTSYTVEFTFRFTESGMENGSLGFLLTCRGEEPTNITSLVIRSTGTVDDFPDPDPAVSAAIRGGKTVTVEIPVEEGAVHRMKLIAGDKSCTLERTDVLVIAQGSMGFAVRNDGAAISDVWVVNGCGYEKKTGDDTSAVRDEPGAKTPSKPGSGGRGGGGQPSGETSPRTGDRTRAQTYQQVAAVTGGAAVILGCGLSHRNRRRRI